MQNPMMSKISKFKIKTGFDLVLARPCLPRLNLISARDPGGVTACLFKEFIITLYEKKRPHKPSTPHLPQRTSPHMCLGAQVPHAAGVREGGRQHCRHAPAPSQFRVSTRRACAKGAGLGPPGASPRALRPRAM